MRIRTWPGLRDMNTILSARKRASMISWVTNSNRHPPCHNDLSFSSSCMRGAVSPGIERADGSSISATLAHLGEHAGDGDSRSSTPPESCVRIGILHASR